MDETPRNLYGEVDVEAAYQAALAVPLADKVRKAILLIQEYEPKALELSPGGYYVAFSGGKDSIVMAKLFEMSGVKYQLWYNNVTIDPPELVRFIKGKYPQAKWNNPDKNFFTMLQTKSMGLPTRNGRWCCEIYKERGGNGFFKAIGVRAEESPRRKGAWTLLKLVKGFPILSPILYFTHADVWEFIAANEMEYCSLYDDGFKRLGCVGCPLGGKNRVIEFKHWPKYEELWKRSGEKWWINYKDKEKPDGKRYFAAKFNTFEDYWSWWMEEGDKDTDKPDCQMFLW